MNLLNTERHRAFKALPALCAFSSNAEHFFGNSYIAGVKIRMAQSTIQTAVWLKSILRITWGPWHTQAKHRRRVKSKLKVQTSSWRVFHTFSTRVCVCVRHGETVPPSDWAQHRPSPQSSLPGCLMSHKKQDVKEAQDKSEQISQHLMKNASSYNHFQRQLLIRWELSRENNLISIPSHQNPPRHIAWLPQSATKRQLVPSFVATQQASFISIITDEPWNSANKKKK